MSESLDAWLWDLEQPLPPSEWEAKEAPEQPELEDSEAKADSPAGE